MKGLTKRTYWDEYPRGARMCQMEGAITPRKVIRACRRNLRMDYCTTMVPTDLLWKYREYTWTREKSRHSASGNPERWDELKRSMAKNGWSKDDPAIFMIGREDGRAKLGEGNHRLAIARELGIKQIPVRFFCDRRVHMKYDPGDPERNIRRRTR